MLSEGLIARFWAKVDKRGPDECWPWIGAKNPFGYGKISNGKRGVQAKAHRVAYEIAVGLPPGDLVVRHKCDNPPCVNPSHLEAGTQADNVHDMVSRGRHYRKKTCAKGHPLNSTRVRKNGSTYRYCDPCTKERLRARVR
jgi:hypothetical protein